MGGCCFSTEVFSCGSACPTKVLRAVRSTNSVRQVVGVWLYGRKRVVRSLPSCLNNSVFESKVIYGNVCCDSSFLPGVTPPCAEGPLPLVSRVGFSWSRLPCVRPVFSPPFEHVRVPSVLCIARCTQMTKTTLNNSSTWVFVLLVALAPSKTCFLQGISVCTPCCAKITNT